ncbi:MAG TPA: transposase [Burkholderiales bacterium]|nr:transposase [Burkholderiales bacterium]
MRLPRYALPGQPQHVIQRGNNRTAMFAVDADYRFFFDCLETAVEAHGCLIHAYVFMTNHVHLVMTPTTGAGLGKVMQSVGRRYVRYFNSKYARTGTLWEGRYRATVIDSEEYLLTCYRYVELNPVRAGLVAHPGQYRWSSYGANAMGAFDPIITAHRQYRVLGMEPETRQLAYRALFHAGIDEPNLRAIRDATNTAWALGSDRFRDAISSALNRRAQPLPKGGYRRRPGQLNRVSGVNGVRLD